MSIFLLGSKRLPRSFVLGRESAAAGRQCLAWAGCHICHHYKHGQMMMISPFCFWFFSVSRDAHPAVFTTKFIQLICPLSFFLTALLTFIKLVGSSLCPLLLSALPVPGGADNFPVPGGVLLSSSCTAFQLVFPAQCGILHRARQGQGGGRKAGRGRGLFMWVTSHRYRLLPLLL